jgi:hypothetical protein
MKWRLPRWKDIFGLALAVGRPIRLDANFGFGPDWTCTAPGKGDPVCLKKQL